LCLKRVDGAASPGRAGDGPQHHPSPACDERLFDAFDDVFPPDRDDRWCQRRADVPRTVRDIYSKHFAQQPPIIQVKAGLRHQAADEGLAAMQAVGIPFYQRDRKLVQVALIEAKNTDGEIIRAPGIIPVTLPTLGRALGQSARWEKISKREKWMRIDPPKEVVEQIAGMVGEWPFPVLSGVIAAPTLRPDGSVLMTEGYDYATGLILRGAPKMPPIPAYPTRQGVIRG
jgi:hypothetical protein